MITEIISIMIAKPEANPNCPRSKECPDATKAGGGTRVLGPSRLLKARGPSVHGGLVRRVIGGMIKKRQRKFIIRSDK